MFNKIINIILILWQFPQMLIGYIIVKLTNAEKRIFTTKDGRKIEYYHFERNTKFTQFISGVSLAAYILLSDNNSEETICHEYGHSIQSMILGWFYLLTVGIYSSVFCNLWQRKFHSNWNRYDRHYWYYIKNWCENWADSLGKVDRENVLRKIPRPANAKYPAMADQRIT